MYNFIFHDIAEGVNEGQVGSIDVKVGDTVKEGDELLVVETDKVTTSLTSPVDGKIAEINVKPGQDINVGDVLMKIDDGKDTAQVAPAAKPASTGKPNVKLDNLLPPDEENASVVGTVQVGNMTLPSKLTPEAPVQTEKKRIIITPIARKLAKDLGVDIEKVKGTGPQGRILTKDVQFAHDNSSAQLIKQRPQQVDETEHIDVEQKVITESKVEKITSVRAAIAKAMVRSVYTLPHTALMDDADVTEISKIRAQYKEQWKKDGLHLSFLPFVIKAVSLALNRFPIINARLDLDKKQITYFKYQNIGIAAATKTGLKVPMLKQAQGDTIRVIAEKLGKIITKVKADRFNMEDFTGGTFTISNYGSIGAKYGTPVINYPESAILGVGKISTEPHFNAKGEIEARQIMGLSLSFDHRLIDGAVAAQFLSYIIELLSNPTLLAIY